MDVPVSAYLQITQARAQISTAPNDCLHVATLESDGLYHCTKCTAEWPRFFYAMDA